MTTDTMIMLSKIISLLLFFPVFIGAVFYAYNRKNKEKLESYAYLPLQED